MKYKKINGEALQKNIGKDMGVVEAFLFSRGVEKRGVGGRNGDVGSINRG